MFVSGQVSCSAMLFYSFLCPGIVLFVRCTRTETDPWSKYGFPTSQRTRPLTSVIFAFISCRSARSKFYA